jgi:hypothetical protein
MTCRSAWGPPGRSDARNLAGRFEHLDFMDISYEGYDVIAAIECLYYPLASGQQTFFQKVAREHRGKTLIISGPIIGQNEHRRYFTHEGILDTFTRHGISVVEFHNLSVYRRTPLVNRAVANLAAALTRAPLGSHMLDVLPDRLTDPTMVNRGWKRPFDDPIPLPRGRQLVTLKDAGTYITELPKAEQKLEDWQTAMQALLLVVKQNGPTMLARIGVMRALHRNNARVFNSDRKDTHWGKRKLKRDQ